LKETEVRRRKWTPIPSEFHFFEKGTYQSKYRLSWDVPYEAGSLKVISYADGKEVAMKEIRTAGAPAEIVLNADRATISGNYTDILFPPGFPCHFLIFPASPGLFRLEDRFFQLPPDYFALPRIVGASPRRKQAKILWEEADILRGSLIFSGGARYFEGEHLKVAGRVKDGGGRVN
jgi:hypothetical protein